jgi:alkylhydroperoxidase family enzyme
VVAFLKGESDAVPEVLRQRVLSFAVKLTRAADTVGADDVRTLRGERLSDAAIHDIVAVTAYFNFVNRMALGLGVELESPASSS